MDTPTQTPTDDSFRGFFCTASAFLIWGISPIYWKSLGGLPAFEILLHRVVWSFFFVIPIVLMQKRWSELISTFKNIRSLLTMLATTLLVAVNWLVFIWAINNGLVLQTSLGYYINPLLSVLLGVILLKERLRRAQAISAVLAGAGVLYLSVHMGQFPWVALALASSFALYGLIRKITPVSALIGLTIETLLLLPPSTGYLLYLLTQGQGAFLHLGHHTDLLLMASALVTALPLLLFALGARRLHLSTVGFMQYIVPSCFFLFAVFLFKEPISRVQILTFLAIWTALAIYSADSMLLHRKLSILHRKDATEPGNQAASG